MQTWVSSSYSTKTGMDRQTKRMNTGMCRTEGFIDVPQRTPISRLKLQFPDLNEEVSIAIFINFLRNSWAGAHRRPVVQFWILGF